MSLNTYLTFDGNCREAFEFYRSVFGGEFSEFHTFAEAPPDMSVPEAEKDLMMHVSLPVGSSVLMGSDSCSSFGPPPAVGSNFSISIVGQSKEHCDEIFELVRGNGRTDADLVGLVDRHLERHLADDGLEDEVVLLLAEGLHLLRALDDTSAVLGIDDGLTLLEVHAVPLTVTRRPHRTGQTRVQRPRQDSNLRTSD